MNAHCCYHPDIAYTALNLNIKEKNVYVAPDLIIDLVYNEGEQSFLNAEKAAFEKAGVKEYWLVNPQTKYAEGFILHGNKYTALGESKRSMHIHSLDLDVSF